MDHASLADGVELEIPARPEYVGLARLVVSSLAAARREIADDRVDDLKLAVSEACTNAIEAHADVEDSERVVVRWDETDDRLQVRVEDRGPGFDPGTLPSHPPVTDPERLNFERGLGIPLIRALVDEVHFHPSDTGTTVEIVMYCGPSDGAEASGGGELYDVFEFPDDGLGPPA